MTPQTRKTWRLTWLPEISLVGQTTHYLLKFPRNFPLSGLLLECRSLLDPKTTSFADCKEPHLPNAAQDGLPNPRLQVPRATALNPSPRLLEQGVSALCLQFHGTALELGPESWEKVTALVAALQKLRIPNDPCACHAPCGFLDLASPGLYCASCLHTPASLSKSLTPPRSASVAKQVACAPVNMWLNQTATKAWFSDASSIPPNNSCYSVAILLGHQCSEGWKSASTANESVFGRTPPKIQFSFWLPCKTAPKGVPSKKGRLKYWVCKQFEFL